MSRTIQTLVVSLSLGVVLSLSSPVGAAELLYYLSAERGAPPEKRLQLKTPEGDSLNLQKEPVARVSSDAVQEAVIVREEVEVLDEEEPVSAVYLVTLVLDEPEQAKVARTMDELCKAKHGVHIVVDGVGIDYRPLVVCGQFRTQVSFLEQKDAEAFAQRFSPKAVRFATPPKE